MKRPLSLRDAARVIQSRERLERQELLDHMRGLAGEAVLDDEEVERLAAAMLAQQPAPVVAAPAAPRTLATTEAFPLPDISDTSWRNDDSAMEMTERRARAISWVIHEKEFERMSLESGDKGSIRELCQTFEQRLFDGSTVFDDAWKLGSKRQWWRMRDYHKFVKGRAG